MCQVHYCGLSDTEKGVYPRSVIFKPLSVEPLAFPPLTLRETEVDLSRKTGRVIGQSSFERKFTRHFDPGGVIFYILCGMLRGFTPAA